MSEIDTTECTVSTVTSLNLEICNHGIIKKCCAACHEAERENSSMSSVCRQLQEQNDRLREALKWSHNAMQTWFSGEYLNYSETRKIEEALSTPPVGDRMVRRSVLMKTVKTLKLARDEMPFQNYVSELVEVIEEAMKEAQSELERTK